MLKIKFAADALIRKEAFKKYVRSKIRSNPYPPHPHHFTPCSSLFVLAPPQRTFVLVSPSTFSQKKFRDVYEFSNGKSGTEKRKKN